jgi:protein SCO1/2
MRRVIALAIAFAFAFLAGLVPVRPAAAQNVGNYGRAPETPPQGLPAALREVGFDQRLGAALPLDATFVDDAGKTVRLGDYFGTKPLLLSLVYYECPMLCNMVLNGVVRSLRVLKFDAGNEFEILTLSFDPEETAELAAAKKKSYVESYGRQGAAAAWHFLTGDAAAIRAVCDSVGFRYTYDAETGEYAHASGIVVVTPDGRISRYFYGVEYAPKDLRLGLIEAADNKIGNVIDQAFLYCFRYDPEAGTYSAVVMNILRVAAAVTVVLVAGLLWILRRREPKSPEPKTPLTAGSA